MHWFNFILAGLLGGLLGIAELLSRYRDRPMRTFRRGAAWAYVTVNASASVLALVLIDQFEWDFGQSGGSLRATQVLVAGLGAAVLFRSSLFIFKVGDDNVGMGPSLVLTSLLGAADRSVDRDQASERLRVVGVTMTGVDFDKAKSALVSTCLAAAANVAAQEAIDLNTAVGALDGSAMSLEAKRIVLGVLIIDTVGHEVLKQAVTTLGDSIK